MEEVCRTLAPPHRSPNSLSSFLSLCVYLGVEVGWVSSRAYKVRATRPTTPTPHAYIYIYMYEYVCVELGEDASALRHRRPPLHPMRCSLKQRIIVVRVVQVRRIHPLRLPHLRHYLYFCTSKGSECGTSGGRPLYGRAEERVRRGTRRSRARAAASFMKCSTRCSVGPAAVLPRRGVLTGAANEPPTEPPASHPSSPSPRRDAPAPPVCASLLRPRHDSCRSVFPAPASIFVLL